MFRKAVIIAGCLGGFLPAVWGLSISPTYQIFSVKAGESVTGECTVTNNEEEHLKIEMTSKNWFTLPENEELSEESWITFNEPAFELNVGESKKISFVVAAPKKAKGELVRMMSFNIKSESMVNINKVLSVAIYAAIKGTEVMKGSVQSVEISASTSAVVTKVAIINEGNIHLRPAGLVEVRNEKKRIVANVVLKQDRPIYPGQVISYQGGIPNYSLPPGNYTAKITMNDVDRESVVVNTEKPFVINKDRTVEMK